ncbi:MAG: MMPL family transporter, partial [Myxococcota bacterium]
MVVVSLVASAGPAAYLASGLELASDFTALLDRQSRPIRDLEAVTQKLGGTAFVVVAIDARDRPLAERFVSELGPQLNQLDAVLFVDGKLDLDWVRARRLLYLPPDKIEELTDEVASFIDARYAERSGLFVDLSDDAGDTERFRQRLTKSYTGSDTLPIKEYLIGQDGRYMYLFARLAGGTGNLSFGRKALNEVKATTEALRKSAAFPSDLDVRYSGSVVIRIEEDRIMSKDLQQTALIGFFGVVLLMMLYTRRLRTLLIVSLPIFVSTTWTFAFARLAIGRLNIITGFLAAILFGLGVDFVIHLFLRYMEARGDGQESSRAFQTTTLSTGRAVISSALTTASAFIVVR